MPALAPASDAPGRASAPLPAPAPELRGDVAMWLLILIEMATFGLLFVVYAFARSREVALFNASQATLDLPSGALNTALLLTGSWCVARAVRALRERAARPGLHWLVGALACAAGFLVLKSLEYADKAAQGITLETNTFYMLYLVLTGFHFLHVVAAALFLAWVAWRVHCGAFATGDAHVPETAAAFWHLVDLLWLVLFPLVYVMR